MRFDVRTMPKGNGAVVRASRERTEDVEPKPYSDEELERVRMVLGSSPDMSDSIGDRMLVTLDNLRKHRDLNDRRIDDAVAELAEAVSYLRFGDTVNVGVKLDAIYRALRRSK